jgi:hypothetical protein
MSDTEYPVSPDGRFRWDGFRWVPTARQQRRTVLLALGLVGSVVLGFVALFALVLGPTVFKLLEAFGFGQ